MTPRLLLAAAIMLASVPGLAQEEEPRIQSYTIVNGRTIPDSLTGQPGDPEAGRLLYFDRGLTRCSACHGSPGGPGALIDREAGSTPGLAGVADRLTEGEVRAWLIVPEMISPGTKMPSFYELGQRDDPNDPFFGQPLLSAVEIENLVAYLMRQRAP